MQFVNVMMHVLTNLQTFPDGISGAGTAEAVMMLVALLMWCGEGMSSREASKLRVIFSSISGEVSYLQPSE